MNTTTMTVPPGVAAPVWAEWICVDIETRAGRPESAEEWARKQWSPASNWTPETIGKRYLEALEKKKGKLALLDAAGIAVVALRFGTTTALIHCLAEQPDQTAEFAMVRGLKTERDMLIALRDSFARIADNCTLLVGHNIRSFDLPRLRLAYLRNDLQIPPALGAAQPHFDSMKEFCRAFSVERSEMISLSDVLDRLGMMNHKGLVDGSQIDELIAKGEYESILRYAALDVLAESEVFLRLTGRSAQLE